MNETELVRKRFRYTRHDLSERKGAGMKRLYKSRNNKVIAGVCGGIGEYLDVDPLLIRIITVIFFFAGGFTFFAYILGMIIIPSQPWETAMAGATAQGQSAAPAYGAQYTNHSARGSIIVGSVLLLFGIHFLLRNVPFFDPYYWWFWDTGWHFIWPSMMILAGLLVIFASARK
jgi:phage shock protein C